MTDEKPKHRAGRTVYIGLRAYNPEKRIAENCNGLNIRAFDFTPEEVHAAIVDALKRLAADYQRQQAQKGEGDGS
jgi:hypothetical protein